MTSKIENAKRFLGVKTKPQKKFAMTQADRNEIRWMTSGIYHPVRDKHKYI